MSNAINWFEISVSDMARAMKFYEAVLGIKLKEVPFMGTTHAVFPSSETGVGGALVVDPLRKPSPDGVLVYLDATGKLDECIDRVAKARGEVVLAKTDIGPPGFIAIARDSEGNLFGLHAPR